MAFTYGGITYHTDEPDPTPLRGLLTGAGYPGGGTPSYYAPVDYSKYLIGGSVPTGTAGGEGGPSGAGGPAINWDAMPSTKLGPASNLTPVGPDTKVFNKNLIIDDPNYGEVTLTSNVNNAQWSDMIGPVIGLAIGAGFGALGAPTWASSLTNAANFAGGLGGGGLTPKSGLDISSLLSGGSAASSAGLPQVTGVPEGMEKFVPLLLLLSQKFGTNNQTPATTSSGGNANTLPVESRGLFTSSPTTGRAGVQ
jgi:hypothetical protein